MNNNHRPTDIEAQLNAAIDALNAGQPVSTNGEPELTSLITTIQRARATDEPEWPDADFPTRMASNLSAQLHSAPRTGSGADNGQFGVPMTPDETPTLPARRAADTLTLAEEDRQPSRGRQFAGMFAAAAAFSLLTLLLITVFRSQGDADEPSGVLTGDDEPRQIAFVKDVEGEDILGQAEIFLVDDDGDNLTNLTDHPANDHAPAWSPDGQTLAFVSNRTGRDQIYLMDADGGNVRQLTSGDGPSEAPAWSPDGDKIAYNQQINGIATPWIMASDGSDQRPLENASEGDPIAAPFIWSPDGEMVAYTYQSKSLGIGISSADGERSRLITLLGEAFDSVDWSANGEWLAITPFTDADNVGLIDARNILDGSEVEPRPLVTGADMFASQPRFAPSGSRLLFFGSVGVPPTSAGLGLYVGTVDGSFIEKIYAPDRDQWPVAAEWSPVGNQIGFTRLGEMRRRPGLSGDTFELVVINADGSDERVLTDDIWAVWTDPPAWRPKLSDATAPPPTEVPQPAQTAVPVPDTEAAPSPEGSMEPEQTITILTPTPPAADFAAQVQAALDALPDEMTGCAATPSTPRDSNGLEYHGIELIGDQPLNAVAFETDEESTESGIAASQSAMLYWHLGTEWHGEIELDIHELEQGTIVTPSWGPVAGAGGWAEGPVHRTFITFPHAGCWQVVATYGDLAGVVWIEVDDAPEDESAETAPPTLTLDPTIGTCEATPVMHGAGFEPGTQLTFFVGQARGDNPATLSAHPAVSVDGTFEAQLDLQHALASACQPGQIPAQGIEYSISVMTGTGPKPDGDDWRDPSASTGYIVVADEASANQEALDAAVLETAMGTVRTFLDEPDAELTGEVVTTPSGERQAFLNRGVDGVPYPDEFIIDVRTSQLLSATIPSLTTLGTPSQPVTEEEAEVLAEQIATRTRPGFDQLTQAETSDGCEMPGADEPDPCVTFSWQLRANDLVWYPSGVSVTMDLETGQVVRYSSYHEVYRGPLEPQITEDEARVIATDDINADPDLEGQAITEMRLAITQIVTDPNPDGAVTGEEWRLTWTAELSGAPESGVRLNIVIDALTGEVLNPEWTANG